jgi:alanine-glyoxylate transaminase/serine-glyoxylate transaminase/serine-pyruvate transaminase
MAALSGVEMGLRLAGVKLADSGVTAAMAFFAAQPAPAVAPALPLAA